MKETKVSVVIPCFNEEKHIESCILSIINNGYPQNLLEIIVVDGNSQDDTPAILNRLKKDFKQVKVYFNNKKVTPISLNIGLKNSSYPLILIASAHSSFNLNYINILISSLKNNPDAVAVGGQMNTLVKNKTKKSLAIREVLMHRFGVGNSKFRIGSKSKVSVDTVPFGLYKKKSLIAAGGYNEKLIRNHDIELSKRLTLKGDQILLIPEAECNYFARENFRELAVNNFKNGKWNLLTIYLTGKISSLSFRHLVPLTFILSLIIPLILTLFFKPFFLIFLISLISYFVCIIYFSFQKKSSKTNFSLLLLAFLSLHLSYGFGSLIGLISIPFFKK
tara:strand:+ start:1968 stop:2969 length:1002 start_codon:yes stop_codon:yes gene_type:complete